MTQRPKCASGDQNRENLTLEVKGQDLVLVRCSETFGSRERFPFVEVGHARPGRVESSLAAGGLPGFRVRSDPAPGAFFATVVDPVDFGRTCVYNATTDPLG